MKISVKIIMDDCKLIEFVRDFPCLYDKANPDFKDANKKSAAWKDTAENLGVDVAVAVRRWENLRERFSKDIRSSKNTSGSGACDGRQWVFLESLQFLRAHIIPRPMRHSSQNINRSVEGGKSTPTVCESRPATPTLPELLSISTQSPLIPPAQSPKPALPQSTPMPQPQSEPSTSRGRRRTAVLRDELDAAIMETVPTFRDVCARRARRENYSADISAFGSMMCSVISSLKKKNQATVMQRCTEIVIQVQIEENDEAEIVEYLYDNQ
ncbi:transcription factor Adf-1-like [Eurosta solidaginis]|uniref:transcription factor Adf-1-like n=1 Tax=Eurosta solidaginis TaxID=178769 RepID=UPI003530BDC8